MSNNNAIVALSNNAAAYDDTVAGFKTLGNNFRSARSLQRKLALNFITASCVDGYALEPLIEDSREAMKWGKLSSDERNRANVFFASLRVIAGAWPKLPEEVRAAFLGGHKVYSTLVSEIKAERKRREEAEANEGEAKASEQAPAQPQAPEQDEAPAKPAVGDPMVAAMQSVALFVDETAFEKMTPEQLLALKNLCDAVDEFRTAQAAKAAKPAKLAA